MSIIPTKCACCGYWYPNHSLQCEVWLATVRAPIIKREDTTNPKDLVGNNKVSLTKFPMIALAHASMAMMDGAEKYGQFNWREKDVKASIYVDAVLRHLMCWFEGQEKASDSEVHHLGHAIASLAILLDAQSRGKLVDDRPLMRDESGNIRNPDYMDLELSQMSQTIKGKKLKKTGQQ